MSSTPSSQARKLGNRSSNFIRRITQTPQRLDTSGLSRTEKLKLANKLSNDNIDLFMLVYAYFIFLAVIIVIVFLYRYKQESPHKFSGDIRDESLWSRFVNWCNRVSPSYISLNSQTTSCEDANRMFKQGNKGDLIC
jgi:hypothetical protein